MKFCIGALLGALFVTIAIPETEARSVVRVGDSVSIATEQIAEGDLYGVGSEVLISGSVSGDAQLLAFRGSLDGDVASDTLMVGISVDVRGTVSDDLRIIAGDATVGGHIRGDLFVMAASLTILPDAVIDGDVIFFGQDADIAGAVGNDVIGNMTNLRIDGTVLGGVQVAVMNLTLGDRANITGALQYTSAREAVRAPNATLGGDLVHNTVPPARGEWDRAKSIAEVTLVLVFAVLAWHLLLRRSLEELVRIATTSYIRSALIGLAIVFVMPFLAGVLIASQLGLLLGVMLIVLFLFLLTVAAIGSLAVAGGLLRQLIAPRQSFNALWVLVGGLLVGLLLYAPAIMVVLPLALLLMTLGACAERFYQLVR